MAQSLGSDVPACLLGATALGSGRGEQLHLLEGTRGIPVLLVNPGVALATADVFARWDGRDRGALEAARPIVMAMRGRNDLEPPAVSLQAIIADVLAALRGADGCTLARMSGSGATCFALFGSSDAAIAAERALAGRYPGWWVRATSLGP